MTEKLTLTPLGMDGLQLMERHPVPDSRGSLERIYCCDVFYNAGIAKAVAQINVTKTLLKGVVRGLHYQISPHSELKVVTCLKGKVFDVAVDLRKNSRTFLKWHAQELSEENNKSLVIPEGFAHGFQALSDNCELLYFHTHSYALGFEAGVNPLDAALSIDWPLPISDISKRDENLPHIDNKFIGLEI